MRVIKARRGSDRINHLVAEAIAERERGDRPPSDQADEARALSATDHD